MKVKRTFCFVDLSEFTSYTEEYGDVAAAAILMKFRTLVRTVASRRGVLIAKWLGDGVMIVAINSKTVVATALELQWRAHDLCAPLALCTGIAGGETILFEGDDYIGTPVNLAARLCQAAQPVEILASSEIASSLPPWARSVPSKDGVLRGFSDPVPLSRIVLATPDIVHVVDPICTLPLSPRAVAVARETKDGIEAFCSEECAQTWDSESSFDMTRQYVTN